MSTTTQFGCILLRRPAVVGRAPDGGHLAADSVRYLADHLPDSQIREIPGAAHFGPLLTPEPVAAELTRHFTAVHA